MLQDYQFGVKTLTFCLTLLCISSCIYLILNFNHPLLGFSENVKDIDTITCTLLSQQCYLLLLFLRARGISNFNCATDLL